MEKDSTIFLPFHGCWFPSLERQRVGFKQDERKLSWGFRHEVVLMRALSGLSPLRFLPLRPKKKRHLLALESYTNHHHHRSLALCCGQGLFHWEERLKIPKFSVLNVNNSPPAGRPLATFSDVMALSSVQSLSHIRLLATPWIAARQASLSITNSWSSPKLMSIDLCP